MTDRIVDRLLVGDTPLERAALVSAAQRIAAIEAPLADAGAVIAAVDGLVGLGPLEALLRDPAVSDVLVNGPYEVWVERSGVLERAAVEFPGPDAVVAAAERAIAPLGLRLDRASPAVDARLADGSRLHAVIPPVAVDGPVLAVRRFTDAVPDLDHLVAAGGIGAAGADLLATAVRERDSIVVSGGTGAGKTTLLNLLSREIPPDERVVTVEDAAELQLAGHVVRLEAREANAEGAGAMPLSLLVRHALRLRPDRIIVGEVRGPEALDMLQAMNTGHAGSMSTVHANSPAEALLRIETLAMAGSTRLDADAVRRHIEGGIRLVVQVERSRGRRRVTAVARLVAGELSVVYP